MKRSFFLLAIALSVLLSGQIGCAQTRPRRAEVTKPLARVITLGHESHGKTTLTSAITKILSEKGQADFIPYDKLTNPSAIEIEGLKINAAHVRYETENKRYDHLDCGSPSDCVKLLSDRQIPVDGAVLVVAATDGPMPQTREHIMLAHERGIRSIVVYINKIDSVDDPELIQLVELEVRELLTSYSFPGDRITFIKGSAKMALDGKRDDIGKKSILDLLSALDAALGQ